MQLKRIAPRFIAALTVVGLCAGLASRMALAVQDETPAPKHSIKDVMKEHKKGGLLPKILAGEGTEDDKKNLLDMYISMLEAKPPKGEMDSWQKLAGAQALAAAKLVVGREGAIDELKEATNCAGCHKPHKP